MVRLKELAERGIPVSTAFQFHYGTIKSRLPLVMLVPVMLFNSTMVRLKAVNEVVNTNLVSFQFHYGTIKS